MVEHKPGESMVFGQFEAHMGRNKRNELDSDGGVGGDKTWRWRFRKYWLEKGLPRLQRFRHEEDTV